MIAWLRQTAVLGLPLLVFLAAAVGQAQSPDASLRSPPPATSWLSENDANSRPWPRDLWETNLAAASSSGASTEHRMDGSRRAAPSPASAVARLFAKAETAGISTPTPPVQRGSQPAGAERKAADTAASGKRPQGSSADPPSAPQSTRRAQDRWTSGALTYQEPEAPDPLDLGGIAARLVFGTALALGAVVACLWAARRWLTGAVASAKGQGRLRVIDSLSLAHRCCVQLIEVDGRQVLVGCDAGGIRSVTPLLPSFADAWTPEAEHAVADLSRG